MSFFEAVVVEIWFDFVLVPIQVIQSRIEAKQTHKIWINEDVFVVRS